MIKLKEILKKILGERSDYYYSTQTRHQLFPSASDERVTFGIVISHKKGITPEEGEKIIKAFEKSDKDADLKYFPATKKVVGKVGVFKFFDPSIVHPSVKLAPYLHKARIRHELEKIKKGLEIDKKTIYK